VFKLVFLSAAAALVLSSAAFAVSDPYRGEMMVTAADFCPVGWLPMNGQVLTIASDPDLYAVVGNAYGGNGTSTFALPLAPPVWTADHRQFLSCIATEGNDPVRP
jgi:microcystin-dependent protein